MLQPFAIQIIEAVFGLIVVGLTAYFAIQNDWAKSAATLLGGPFLMFAFWLLYLFITAPQHIFDEFEKTIETQKAKIEELESSVHEITLPANGRLDEVKRDLLILRLKIGMRPFVIDSPKRVAAMQLISKTSKNIDGDWREEIRAYLASVFVSGRVAAFDNILTRPNQEAAAKSWLSGLISNLQESHLR